MREAVAAQEGYKRMFLAFAPSWAAEEFAGHRANPCVLQALGMRQLLLAPFDAWVAHDNSEIATIGGAGDADALPPGFSFQLSEPLTARKWFDVISCRIDSLDVTVQALAAAIEREAEATKHAAVARLLRLVGPLIVVSCVSLFLVGGASHSFHELQRAAEARASVATRGQRVYKQLAQRWAPLSLQLVEEQGSGEDEGRQPS